MGEQPVGRVDLAEELIPLGAKVLDHITVSAGQRFSLLAVNSSQRFNLLFADPEEFAHTCQFGLEPSGLQRRITGFARCSGRIGYLNRCLGLFQSLPRYGHRTGFGCCG